MMKTAFALALAAFLLALPASLSGEQRVSGIIDRETRWRAEDGPFIVEGDILVAKRGNLVIFPGARIIIKEGARKGGLADPFDKADSSLVSIRVQGSINCVGRRDNPIVFEPEKSELAGFKWRGIIIDAADGKHSEIAFAEISGAAAAVTITNSNIMVRNCALENNNIGVHALQGGSPRIYNNLISSNFTAAIKVERANPQVVNNIIAFNSNLGLWCDKTSQITFRHNCVFGNADGSFLDCDPELGQIARGARGKDSADANGNIMADPVFIGSPAEARAIEIDVSLQTDSAKAKDKRLLNIPKFQFGPPKHTDPTLIGSPNRRLSAYSPCINAGDPGGAFKNIDGTRNTIGPSGGPDFADK